MSAYRAARDGINTLLGLVLCLVFGATVIHFPDGLAAVKKASKAEETILMPWILCSLFIIAFLLTVITSLVVWAILHAFFDRADAALSSEALLAEEQMARSTKP